MFASTPSKLAANREKGTTLPLFAVTLLVLLFMAALSIDFATLYVARSEAQRAADAAALAGAQRFALTGCLSSGNCSGAQADAIAAAQAAGSQNKVGGQAASIQSGDVTFPTSPSPYDPLVQVKVVRSSARGNGLPTYFMRVLGSRWATLDVSARATAEAFNPIGSNSLGSGCVKPWILPNCDPYTAHTSSPMNSLCAGGPYATFVNATTGVPSNPDTYPTGVKGQLLILKPGNPSGATAPSQYYPIAVPEGPSPSLCPPGAATGNGGGALYERNIECCSTAWIGCGQTTASPETGNLVGPTRHGVDLLIHEGNNGSGQDSFDPTTFAITGGASNPNPALVGKTVTSSSSVCTVPIYDGTQLCPGQGQPCGATVNIVGFMTIFVKDETNPQGTVEAYILNVGGCGTAAGGGPPGGTSSGSPSFVPIRLVQNP
jgi:hypothetical protein